MANMPKKQTSKADPTALTRQYGPEVVRTCAQVAREAPNRSRKGAIAQLVARRFLTTHHPSDADLQRIESMTDAEIQTILSSSFH
jgi:hypothetical protein